MNKNKSYPRERGERTKPKRRSHELKGKMKYNTIINDNKIKFYDMVETKDTYLVQNILRLEEIKV